MIEYSIQTPSGYTIFCDDLRGEINGKLSIMGVVSGTLFMTEDLPIIIPKFCMLVHYFEKHGEKIPNLNLEVFLPENDDSIPTVSIQISSPEQPPAVDELFGDRPLTAFTVPVTLSPFVISQEGAIKVRMRRGDDIVRLGRLVIRRGVFDGTQWVQVPSNTDTAPPS